MHRFAVIFLCCVCVFGGSARGQNANIGPIHAEFGTILTFHVQTRLNPSERNEADILPNGTVIRVTMLKEVDSSVDRDGSEIHGEDAETASAGNKVIVSAEPEMRGTHALV